MIQLLLFQLLRRELGAELGSVVESIRRYIQRGNRTSTSLLPSPAGLVTNAIFYSLYLH